ncbi:MAG: type II toxin-antitoxin system RatA family toxin [Cellvibrionales bacterium]|nr:type II toxin-antitoxin system RatA family toxin [Cellvibrionales bacterium]
MRIHRSAHFPHTAEQLYALINDIASYPNFLPGCVGAQVLSASEHLMEARLDLSAAGMRHSLVTRNRLTPCRRISMELLTAPPTVRAMTGHWQIEPRGAQGCQLSLEIRLQTAQPLVQRVAQTLAEQASDRVVEAFIGEAARRYGEAKNGTG